MGDSETGTKGRTAGRTNAVAEERHTPKKKTSSFSLQDMCPSHGQKRSGSFTNNALQQPQFPAQRVLCVIASYTHSNVAQVVLTLFIIKFDCIRDSCFFLSLPGSVKSN